MSEGDYFTVRATNLSPNTYYDWAIVGSGVTASDLAPLTGRSSTSNGTIAEHGFTVAEDRVTEGT